MLNRKLFGIEFPMFILLLGVLLTHLATYLVIPILPIILTINANLSIIQAGTILAAISISFQVGSILGGVLADRIGRRLIIGLGALVTSFGWFGFGFLSSYFMFVLMAAVIGLGNGLNAPSTKAAIAAIASKENRTTAFSLRGIAANIGTGSAGLIIFFIISGSSKLNFWIAGTIFLVLAIISWLFLPKHNCGNEPCPELPKGAYRDVTKNKPFLVFSTVTIFIWALYTQLSLALPLRATAILATPENVALIWTINSVVVISTQSYLSKKFIQRVHPLTALSIGMVFLGVGLGSLYFSASFIHLAFSGITFVIGEMLILPTIDSTISQLSKAQLIGLFFGLANVVSGIGEAGGRFIGGRLLESGTTTPWVVYLVTGLTLSVTVMMLKRWKPLQSSLVEAASQDDAPKVAPRVMARDNRSHPFDDWEQEVFFRKRIKEEEKYGTN